MATLHFTTNNYTTHSYFPDKNYNPLRPFLFPKKTHRGWAHISTYTIAAAADPPKIVVIMGTTSCGKSKLSVDLASRFFPPSEIINSDKMQAYRGLDITVNRISLPERRNVRHHILGEFDPTESHPEFTPYDFRTAASSAISQIISRQRLPIVVGGSNTFVYALLTSKFDPELDVFSESGDSGFCRELRYNCCFIWLDVALPVLKEYLCRRVDDMLDRGMFNELREYFKNSRSNSVSECGLRKAIGVPEFEGYFRRFEGQSWRMKGGDEEEEKKKAYDEAVRMIRENAFRLAMRQRGKILRLRDSAGWDLNRVEATAAIKAEVEGEGRTRVAEIWEREVVEASVKIVKKFLME